MPRPQNDEPYCMAPHCPVDARDRCDYPECMSDYVARSGCPDYETCITRGGICLCAEMNQANQ